LAKLAQNNNGLVTLLEAGAYHIKLNVLTDVGVVKVGVADVKITRQKDLDWRCLCVKTDFALEGHRCFEYLTSVRQTQVGLELHTVIKTAFEDVCATEGMLNDRDASGLNISLWETDALVFVT
jgi:hypothetical protein